jgi:hypothetical protein
MALLLLPFAAARPANRPTGRRKSHRQLRAHELPIEIAACRKARKLMRESFDVFTLLCMHGNAGGIQIETMEMLTAGLVGKM